VPKKVLEKDKPGHEKPPKKWRWASWRQWVTAAIAMAAVLLLDQVSKALIVANLGPNEWATLIEPLLKVTHAHNYQGIFSLSFGPQWLYIILPLLAVGFVIYLLLRPQTKLITVLLGLILGGGFGNFIDRVRLGYVIDWISMGIRGWRWPTYNIADGSIVVAVTLLLAAEFFFTRSKKKDEADPEAEKP
jgi:signal peptidase II